jgi:hypothetical protein
MPPFDPHFDDARWTLDWVAAPIVPVPLGSHPDGYVVVERMLTRAQIFDRFYEAAEPFPVRALVDPAGKLWMSDTPQERMMMYNNAMQSRGHILIGGLGLGMYPQYAAARATRLTIVERSWAVIDIVGPALEQALKDLTGFKNLSGLRPIPFEIIRADVDDFLAAEPSVRYDTVFLDTWDTLDARRLPHVNRLRDLAIRHLAPDGRVLLWGYRWMVRLFEDACRQLLGVPSDQRQAWLAEFNQPEAAALLQPVVDHFKDVRRTPTAPGAKRSGRGSASHVDAALQWCRKYIVSAREALPGA